MGDNTVELDPAILAAVQSALEQTEVVTASANRAIANLRQAAGGALFGQSQAGQHMADVLRSAVTTIQHIVEHSSDSATNLSLGTVEAVRNTGTMSDDSIERFNTLAVQSKKSATAASGSYLPAPATTAGADPGSGAGTDPSAGGTP